MNAHQHPTAEQLWAQDVVALAHADGCARCRTVRDQVVDDHASVTALLTHATPEPMPEAVARHLQEALRFEAAARGTQQDAEAEPGPDELAEHRARRARPRLAAWFGVAAAAMLVVVAGVVVTGPSSGPPAVPAALLARAVDQTEATEPAEAEVATDDQAPSQRGSDAASGEAKDPRVAQARCGAGILSGPDDVVVDVLELADDPGGVLVTVSSGDETVVWWLPTCDAAAEDARGRSTLP